MNNGLIKSNKSSSITEGRQLKLVPELVSKRNALNYTGRVSDYNKSGQCWVIDEHLSASCALSLLVQPSVGDKVCFIKEGSDYYIISILTREDKSDILKVYSDKKIHWLAPELRFTALNSLELVSLSKIMVTTKNHVMSVANTIIQQTENLIQQVGQLSITAKGLVKLSGKQQIITAEKDVRIDGKRINMG